MNKKILDHYIKIHGVGLVIKKEDIAMHSGKALPGSKHTWDDLARSSGIKGTSDAV